MSKRSDRKGKYRVTVHYIQELPPQKIGQYTITVLAVSPNDALQSAIYRRREADPDERVYPTDIHVIVVVGINERTVHVFGPTLQITSNPRGFAPDYRDTVFVPLNRKPYLLRCKYSSTYRTIQQYVKRKYGVAVSGCHIAHVKEICGLSPRKAPNRRNPKKRANPCPDDKKDLIVEAFRHFKWI